MTGRSLSSTEGTDVSGDSQSPTAVDAIEDGIATAAWPNGERFVHLAQIHRHRVAEHVIKALHAAGLRVVSNGEHLLHQEEDSWAMEHTVDCRQRGLMQCDLHELACSGAWEGVAPGVYRLVDLPAESVRLEVWP